MLKLANTFVLATFISMSASAVEYKNTDRDDPHYEAVSRGVVETDIKTLLART